MWEWGKKRNGDRKRKENILRGYQVGNYGWKIVKLFSWREPKSILKAMYIMGILKLLCLRCRPISYYVPTPTIPAEAHFYIYSKMYYTVQCLLWNWIFKGSEDRVSFDTFQNRQHTQMLVKENDQGRAGVYSPILYSTFVCWNLPTGELWISIGIKGEDLADISIKEAKKPQLTYKLHKY